MTTLLESGARPYGSAKGVALSMGLHGALIAAAIAGTAAVTVQREKIEEHPVVYVAPPPPAAEPVHVAPAPPAAKAPKPKTVAVKRAEAPRPRMIQVARQPQVQPKAAPTPMPAAPTKIALSVPAIDVKTPAIGDIVAPPAPDRIDGGSGSHRVTSESGGDVEGSGTRGLNSGSAAKAYSENEVERTVEVMRAPEPRYPDALRGANMQGIVVMHFIVSADGRVEPGSISVVSSPHKLFTEAVRNALLSARYRPAQAGGHAVRQLVEQSFSFRLQN